MSGPLSRGYVHACQRAELLGLPTPSEAEWLASEECSREREAQEDEDRDDAVAEELDSNEESMKQAAGGLDELNTILNATQKKINKFKNVCGSLGTLLKARVSSSQPGTPEHKPRPGCSSEPMPSTSGEQSPTVVTAPDESEDPQVTPPGDEGAATMAQMPAAHRKADLNTKVSSHIDKLDSLINKAENAQYSMQHQTKQMKSFLK